MGGRMKISIGKKSPSFSLKDKDGNVVSLNNISSDYVVIYFYPRDNTPGCTLEAKEFTLLKKQFSEAGATIVGISGGDEKTKTKFCSAHKLTITLLSDPDFKVCSAYEVYGKKSFMGRSFMGIMRTTFVLGPNRKILHIFDNVKAKGHAENVLSFIKEH